MSGPSLRERVRMALAEAGYPNAVVSGPDDDPGVALSGRGGVPELVCWQAFRVAGVPDQPCWPCWSQDLGDACVAGDCQPGVPV